MRLSILTVLGSALLVVATPIDARDDAELSRITKALIARNPACYPVCTYPGDTCCSCCYDKRDGAVAPSREVLDDLKKRNPYCVPFCQYPGDTCCGCCD